jgi:hypothetical protein
MANVDPTIKDSAVLVLMELARWTAAALEAVKDKPLREKLDEKIEAHMVCLHEHIQRLQSEKGPGETKAGG